MCVPLRIIESRLVLTIWCPATAYGAKEHTTGENWIGSDEDRIEHHFHDLLNCDSYAPELLLNDSSRQTRDHERIIIVAVILYNQHMSLRLEHFRRIKRRSFPDKYRQSMKKSDISIRHLVFAYLSVKFDHVCLPEPPVSESKSIKSTSLPDDNFPLEPTSSLESGDE